MRTVTVKPLFQLLINPRRAFALIRSKIKDMLLILVTSFFIACRKVKNEPISIIFFSTSNLLPPESSKNAVINSTELGKASRFKIQNLNFLKILSKFRKLEVLLRKLKIQIFKNMSVNCFLVVLKVLQTTTFQNRF